MLRILFWNTAKKPVRTQLATLCQQLEPEVVIVAECNEDEDVFSGELTRATGRVYRHPLGVGKRIQFATTFDHDRVKPLHDDNLLSIRKIVDPLAGEIIIAAVHLPSKVCYAPEDQAFMAMRTAAEIRDQLENHGDTPTIIIGDFNMNPFEPAMIASEGFHAIADKAVAKRRRRIVQGKSRPIFYNACWNWLGDVSHGPPGTCYFPRSTPVSFFWNTFDQALVSHHLLDAIGEFRIVDKAPNTHISTRNGRPNKGRASDHFPIFFEIKTELLRK